MRKNPFPLNENHFQLEVDLENNSAIIIFRVTDNDFHYHLVSALSV